MSVCEGARLAGGHQAFTSASGLTSSFRTCCWSIEKDAVEVKRFFLGESAKREGRNVGALGRGKGKIGLRSFALPLQPERQRCSHMKRETEAVLAVCGLHIRRGKTTILHSVSWSVERGQHWVILGANGSGKTSLLSALTGYLTPSSGEIGVLGRRYGETDWRELQKQIGLVSSSVRQMMSGSEPALDTIVSGKYAMIDYWGRVTRS